MQYNWQQSDWPTFSYDATSVQVELLRFSEKLGNVGGVLKALPESAQLEMIVNLLVSEAVKTSEIEGEFLSRVDVMSSIKNNLGMSSDGEPVRDLRARGVAELVVAVRNTYPDELTSTMLFDWHAMLLRADSHRITLGAWRTHKEPMRVISGAIGKEVVHFEAPPSKQVPKEMERYITWYNSTFSEPEYQKLPALIRAAIVHLYFETIHPFEDGNGRIGRALSEKAISQSYGYPVLLSLSKTIEENKKAYYGALKQAQRSNEITQWLIYFVQVALDAISYTQILIDFVLKKAKFFDRTRDQLNFRQLKVVIRMLGEGPDGFDGGMNAKKYMGITGASKATATRDMQQLVKLAIFTPVGAGRSARYDLLLEV